MTNEVTNPLDRSTPNERPTSSRMPVGFVAHGAPTLALDHDKGAPLARWGTSVPTPRAILVVSAHWTATPVKIGRTRGRTIVHDFGGFPDALYRLRYDAPGSAATDSDLRGVRGLRLPVRANV